VKARREPSAFVIRAAALAHADKEAIHRCSELRRLRNTTRKLILFLKVKRR